MMISMKLNFQRKFAKYEADIRSLSAENNNLRDAMKAGGSDPESISKKTWYVFT